MNVTPFPTQADPLALLDQMTVQIAVIRHALLAAQAAPAPVPVEPVREPQLMPLMKAAEVVFQHTDFSPDQKRRKIQALVDSGKLDCYRLGGQRAEPGEGRGKTGANNLLVDLSEVWEAVRGLKVTGRNVSEERPQQ